MRRDDWNPEASRPTGDWHALDAAETIERLETDAREGLQPTEAKVRLARYGPNRLPEARRRGPLVRFLLQFHNPLVYVLLAAAALMLGLEDYVDSVVIAAVVLVNAFIGFVQEGKAERALEAVRAMLADDAVVVRGGERHSIPAADLVPGDLVVLEPGAKVPADVRLLYVRNLGIEEAALTGESVPVEKGVGPVPVAAPVADRASMAYAGTVVRSGLGRGVVVATGAATELGRIGTLVGGVASLATPLTRRLDQFARQVTVFILAVGVLTFAYGHFAVGMPVLDILLAVVGLAVAAIPEGLPAVVTITLAVGTTAMARKRAIVRRLPAVETLGSVTVICSDKTGTLTRNEMTAVQVLMAGCTLEVTGVGYAPEGGLHEAGRPVPAADEAALRELLRCGALCNDARLHASASGEWRLVGDPTEGALLALVMKGGLDPATEREDAPRVDEIPFESEHRFMATLHHDHAGSVFIYLKGAPERVLELCVRDATGAALDAAAWSARLDAAAGRGYRLIALARDDVPAGTTALAMHDLTRRFTLLGVVGMIDPPRPEAVEAVAECRGAGVRVKMITGDHVITAAAIGAALGLKSSHAMTGAAVEAMDDAALQEAADATDVIARASPEHKLRLVGALQARGDLVAMTGDGVNDAPALKAADIGVAMGERGTDAAREASDLVLTDDNFATIARAVREGRVVFDNIKKALVFMLPTNGGQAGVILLAVFAGVALPVTAGQILWVNTVSAVTLALALAFESAESDVMRRPPRPPGEPILTRVLLVRVAYVSLLMVAATFAAFEWELHRGSSLETARTAAVNMLVVGELFYLFNMRHFTAHAFRRETLFGNRVAIWASLALVVMQLAFTYAPPLQALFHSAPLDATSWLVLLALGFAKFLAVEAEKLVLRRRGVQRM